MRAALLQCLLLLTCSAPALSAETAVAASPLTGVATVIDGDTIEIHGRRIRFHGVDAPEATQTCRRDSDGSDWPCGRRAAQALDGLVAGRTVHCVPEKVDRYGRLDARCTVGGEDIEAWLVRNGWALAYRRYSLEYVDEEQAARSRGLNIWSGAVQKPERYRRELEARERRRRPAPDS